MVVHVDDIFAVRRKSRCNRLHDKLNHLVPGMNVGELRWFGGWPYSRDWERGTLTIFQKMVADELVRTFQFISEQNVPLRVGEKL